MQTGKPIKNHTLKGISSIIGGIFQRFTISTIIPLGSFTAYLMSYLHTKNSSVTLSNGYFLFPILSICIFIFSFFGGYLGTKVGVMKTIILGELILIAAGASLTFSNYLFLDYIIMSFYGLGIGLTVTVTVKNVCLYFPSRRGVVSSILSSFATIGMAGFNFLGEFIINPHKTKAEKGFYPPEVAERIKYYLLFQISANGIFTLFALLFIVPFEGDQISSKNMKEDATIIEEVEKVTEGLVPPKTEDATDEPQDTQQKDEIQYDDIPKPEEVSVMSNNPNNYSVRHIKNAIKSWRVWNLSLVCFFGSFGISVLTGTIRKIGINNKIDEKVLQYSGILSFVVSCVFAPIWGFLVDHISFRLVLLLINGLATGLSFGFYFTWNSNLLFFIVSLLSSVVMSGNLATMGPHLMKVFGMKYYIEISSIIVVSSGVSSLLGSTFAFIIEKTLGDNNNAYMVVFMIGGCFGVVAIILGFFEGDNEFEYSLN